MPKAKCLFKVGDLITGTKKNNYRITNADRLMTIISTTTDGSMNLHVKGWNPSAPNSQKTVLHDDKDFLVPIGDPPLFILYRELPEQLELF